MRHSHTNLGGDPLRMWVDHLKIWIVEAWAEENTDSYRCHIVVEMVQLTFETG